MSKGLGCPVGSVLVGDAKLIHNAIRVRKVLGGGMRQAGFLAAAGIYAMDNHIERLAQDHQKAKALGEVLKTLDFIKKVEPLETNIIIFELDESKLNVEDFLAKLAENQISIIGMGQGKLRMVTHLDYTDEMHEIILKVLKSI